MILATSSCVCMFKPIKKESKYDSQNCCLASYSEVQAKVRFFFLITHTRNMPERWPCSRYNIRYWITIDSGGNPPFKCNITHALDQCFLSSALIRCVDVKSQNSPTSKLLAGEFWELKSTHFNVAKVEKKCTGILCSHLTSSYAD